MEGIASVQFILICLGMVISLTLHELAHARTALAFGDPTAKMMGRVTFNPLAHLDLVGSIVFVMSALAGVGFGWAKPVPVNKANLHPPRLGDIMVSAAGPLANLGLAVVSGLLIRLMIHFPQIRLDAQTSRYILEFLFLMVVCNISLFIFNLIPLYPLDGHHIQREILPAHLQVPFMQWQMSFGRYLLLAIIFLPGVLRKVLNLPIPDQLGWLFTVTIFPIADFLTGISGG